MWRSYSLFKQRKYKRPKPSENRKSPLTFLPKSVSFLSLWRASSNTINTIQIHHKVNTKQAKMIVYRDILSGDEMITDAFKLLPVMDKEGTKVGHSYIPACQNWCFCKTFEHFSLFVSNSAMSFVVVV